MSETQLSDVITPTSLSSCVRFSKEEYFNLVRDQAITGKSIPWLLKTAYFKQRIAPPALDLETRKSIRREFANIGNNLNQLTRYAHSGLIADFKEDLRDCLQAIKTLRSFLGRDYGDREDSV